MGPDVHLAGAEARRQDSRLRWADNLVVEMTLIKSHDAPGGVCTLSSSGLRCSYVYRGGQTASTEGSRVIMGMNGVSTREGARWGARRVCMTESTVISIRSYLVSE